MISHTEQCADSRGQSYLDKIFLELAEMMGCRTQGEAVQYFRRLVEGLEFVHDIHPDDLDRLVGDVNLERLKNNPVKLDREALKRIYISVNEWK
jgi:alcohol dehydrogenase class IV